MGLEKKEKSSLQSLLRTITDLHCARAFRTRVDPRRYPDYCLVIATPMDLRTMRKKLSDNAYSSIEEFYIDARLLFDNCRKYTPDALHPIRLQCDELERRFEAKWQAFLTKVNTDTPTDNGKKKRKSGKKLPAEPEPPANLDNSQADAPAELTIKIRSPDRKASENELQFSCQPHTPDSENGFQLAVSAKSEILKLKLQHQSQPPAPTSRTTVRIPVSFRPTISDRVQAALTPPLVPGEAMTRVKEKLSAVLVKYGYVLPRERYRVT